MEKLNDHEIIISYLKGNEGAFDILVKRYMTQIYRFVYRYAQDAAVAEDITQHVFLKVWKNMKKIDQTKNFKSWLYTIAKNTALDFLKKKKSVPFSQFETPEGKNVLTESLADTMHLPDRLAQVNQDSLIFLDSISQLSEKYQLILSMYYYEYLNFREIAEKLKEPINTIKSRHRRGLILLKKIIGGDALNAPSYRQFS
jgi:RNA polymerase sigma-70 factor (ECF subfamily)